MPSLRVPDGAREAVKATGDPLTVDAIEYDDANQPQPTGRTERVTLFLDGDIVRSASEAEAPLILAAAIQARQEAQALRQRVITVANSAVGIQLDALNATQVRALLACLLHKAGAIDKAGAIRPLGEWL